MMEDERRMMIIGSSNGSTNLGDQSMWESAVDVSRAVMGNVGVVTDAWSGWAATRADVDVLPMLHEGFRRWRHAPRSKIETALRLIANVGEVRRGLVQSTKFVGDDRELGPVGRRWRARIDGSRAVVISGAGGITDEFALHGVVGWSAIVRRAQRSGLPVALIGQGIGPIVDQRTRNEVRMMLESADLVTLRDGASLEVIRSLGYEGEAVVTADWAIALDVGDSDRIQARHLASEVTGGREYLAVSFHDRATIGKGGRRALVEVMTDIASQAQEHGLAILGIANCTNRGRTDDRIYMRRLFDELPSSVASSCRVMESVLSAPVARAMFGDAKAVVATRYHPIVFSLAEGTPAYGLSFDPYYDQKLGGALGWYGEADHVVDMRDLADVNSDWIAEMLDDQSRSVRLKLSGELLEDVKRPYMAWLEQNVLA